MKSAIIVCHTLLFCLSMAPVQTLGGERSNEPNWSPGELRILQSLWIEKLGPLPPDPSNRIADDQKAIDLGKRLFFDVRFSANGEVACATCHLPDLYFTDGRKLARGIGETKRGAPSLLGTAYSPWLYWDGRRDSLWSQALVPLETDVEHGFDRHRVIATIAADDALSRDYRALFGPLPDETDNDETTNRAFANVGKALAAFERTLLPAPSRFDAYVEAVLDDSLDAAKPILNPDEIAGLRLFISDAAQCLRCHNGPLFTNFGFHNIGLIEGKRGKNDYDFGRVRGVKEALADPFRCTGPYSDAKPKECIEQRFVLSRARELVAAFKVPTLRNVTETAPYMHDGRFETIRDVLEHYKKAPSFRIGFQQLLPLDLTPTQLNQIAAFLGTLTGPPPTITNDPAGRASLAPTNGLVALHRALLQK